MKEKIIRFERGPKFKKYTAYVKDKKTKKIRIDKTAAKIGR